MFIKRKMHKFDVKEYYEEIKGEKSEQELLIRKYKLIKSQERDDYKFLITLLVFFTSCANIIFAKYDVKQEVFIIYIFIVSIIFTGLMIWQSLFENKWNRETEVKISIIEDDISRRNREEKHFEVKNENKINKSKRIIREYLGKIEE